MTSEDFLLRIVTFQINIDAVLSIFKVYNDSCGLERGGGGGGGKEL